MITAIRAPNLFSANARNVLRMFQVDIGMSTHIYADVKIHSEGIANVHATNLEIEYHTRRKLLDFSLFIIHFKFACDSFSPSK